MRPPLALVAAEEVGVVAVQVAVRAVRRAGRQVAVVGREGRSHGEVVAEVHVHAHGAAPGGELVAAFIPPGVQLGVGARAFHPHVEVGEVFVDVGGVDAHEGGAVPDPSHLVAQGVLLGRSQRVDRASRCCGQLAGGGSQGSVFHVSGDGVGDQVKMGCLVLRNDPFGFIQHGAASGGVVGGGSVQIRVFRALFAQKDDVAALRFQAQVVEQGKEAGGQLATAPQRGGRTVRPFQQNKVQRTVFRIEGGGCVVEVDGGVPHADSSCGGNGRSHAPG